MMKGELLVLAVAAAGFVVLILCSRVVRAMFRESVLHPKETCDIHVGAKNVVVVARDGRDGKEVDQWPS